MVCDISGEKTISGSVSSGPVQVTSITESYSASDNVKFAIVIENKGGGEVYSKDVECGMQGNIDKNKVYVDIYPDDIVCSFVSGQANSGETALQSGPRTLICEKTVTESDNYPDNLNIDLSYKYVDTTATTVLVMGS